MSLEQSVAANTNWINSVIAKSKLSSELTELIKIINSNQRVVVQEGSNDAEFVKIPNLRGFSGFWNAQTNTPVLSNGTGVSGDVYSASVGGLMDLGSGQISFEVGDLIYYNGVKWFNLNNNSSVNITGTQSIGGEKTFIDKLTVNSNVDINKTIDANNVDSINVESTINGLVDSSTRYKSNDFSTNVAGTNTLNRVYNLDSKLSFGGTTAITSNVAASTNTIITNTDEAISLVDAYVNYNLLYMQEGGGTTNISNIASANESRVYFNDPNATVNGLFGYHINLDYYKGTVTKAAGIEINIQAPSFTTTETTIGEFSYIRIGDTEAFTQGVTGDSWVINSLSPLPSRFYGNIGVVVDKAITLSDVSFIKQISTAFGDFSIADSIKYVSESGSHFFMDDNGDLSNIHADKVITREIKLSALNLAPSSSTATGALGEIRYTADYIYVCTATDTWKRTALTTW